MNHSSCGPCDSNPSESVEIIQGYGKSFYVDLFYVETGEPFDLTGATEIVAAFPGASGTPVQEKLSLAKVAVIGAAGAGKIKISLSADDSALLLLNPSSPQFQDLQVSVTNLSGVYAFLLKAVLNILPPPYGVL